MQTNGRRSVTVSTSGCGPVGEEFDSPRLPLKECPECGTEMNHVKIRATKHKFVCSKCKKEIWI